MIEKKKLKKKKLLQYRDSVNDVLKETTKDELYRIDIDSIIIANFKRAQESARVLEEVFKLIDIRTSEVFKKNRYEWFEMNNMFHLKTGYF